MVETAFIQFHEGQPLDIQLWITTVYDKAPKWISTVYDPAPGWIFSQTSSFRKAVPVVSLNLAIIAHLDL